MLPSALLTASAFATETDFGAEPSQPASLLCTLRAHQSPGEWQHSLPACVLALAGRDLHPLDSTKRFHLLMLDPPLPSFSQRDSHKSLRLLPCPIHVGITPGFQPQRRGISPAAVGCKSLLGR